jgi:hypothetical protein
MPLLQLRDCLVQIGARLAMIVLLRVQVQHERRTPASDDE